jgi:hypothetical protein
VTLQACVFCDHPAAGYIRIHRYAIGPYQRPNTEYQACKECLRIFDQEIRDGIERLHRSSHTESHASRLPF